MILNRKYAVNKLHFENEGLAIDDFMLVHLTKLLDEQNALDQQSKIRNEVRTVLDKDTRTQFLAEYNDCGNITIKKVAHHY